MRTRAFRANRDGPAELARLCEAAGIPLIHVSTDYVFDGIKGAPYVETDPTAPQGVYGASKLAGEQAVMAACSRAIVLRTSWVYSPIGKNFVRTMLGRRAAQPPAAGGGGPAGCPTSAPDLAEAILGLPRALRSDGWQDRYAGIYHAAGSGETTWHGLATATFEAASRHGQAAPEVAAIATDEWPTKATPAARLPARLRQAGGGVRPAPAALAATAWTARSMRSSPQRVQRSVIERPEPSHKAARLTPPIAAGETNRGVLRDQFKLGRWGSRLPISLRAGGFAFISDLRAEPSLLCSQFTRLPYGNHQLRLRKVGGAWYLRSLRRPLGG